jgi:hypothetical protein
LAMSVGDAANAIDGNIAIIIIMVTIIDKFLFLNLRVKLTINTFPFNILPVKNFFDHHPFLLISKIQRKYFKNYHLQNSCVVKLVTFCDNFEHNNTVNLPLNICTKT